MADNILTKLKELDSDFNDLYTRMDDEAEQLKGAEYWLPDLENPSKKFPNAVNITRNTPLRMVDYANSKLLRLNPQFTIEGEGLNDKKTSMLEQYCRGWLSMMDDSVRVRRKINFLSAIGQQAFYRGRIAGIFEIVPNNSQSLLGRASDFVRRKRSGVVSIRLCDARYCKYKFDANGLKLFSATYKRSAKQIADEYGINPKNTNATTLELTVAFERDGDQVMRYIIVDGEDHPEELHPDITQIPALVVLTPKGLFFEDTDAIKQEGWSIATTNMKTWENLNKVSSIGGTIMQKILADTKVHYKDNPKGDDIDPKGVNSPGAIIPIPLKDKLESLPIKDFNAASMALINQFEADEQRAGYTAPTHGTGSSGRTATEIESDLAAEYQVHGPGILAMQEFIEQACYMSISQIREQKLTVPIGARGFETDYKWSELEGAFEIKCELTEVNPVRDLAYLKTGVEIKASQLFSDDTILRDVVKHDNPEEEMAKKKDEEMEREDPIIRQSRRVHALISEREEKTGIDADTKNLEVERALQVFEYLASQDPAMQGPQEPKGVAPMAANPLGGNGSRPRVPVLPGGGPING